MVPAKDVISLVMSLVFLVFSYLIKMDPVHLREFRQMQKKISKCYPEITTA